MDESAAKQILQEMASGASEAWDIDVSRIETGIIHLRGWFNPIEIEAVGAWFKTNSKWPPQ